MRVISRVALVGVLLMAPAACSSDDESGKVALVCPTVGVLSDASKMRMFADGAGQDQANTAYEAEFMRARLLACEMKKNEIKASVRFEARAKTGPAVSSNKFEYPYFVAILSPDGEVVSKAVRTGSVKFKSGRTEAFFAQEYDDIKFTVPDGKDGLGYEIIVGFQLSREQIEANRARDTRPAEQPGIIMQ